MGENLKRIANAVVVEMYLLRRGIYPFFMRDKNSKTNIVLLSVN